jgi:hypothetical protein
MSQMFEAPKQEHDKYTDAQLEQMVPEYMKLMDAQDEEGGVVYLKDQFHERPVDILRFAGLVAVLIDDRKKDKSPEVQEDANTGIAECGGAGQAHGEVAGSDDKVESALPAGDNSGADGGSNS